MNKHFIQLTAKDICSLISFIEDYNWEDIDPISLVDKELLKRSTEILSKKFEADKVHFRTVSQTRVYSVYFSRLELNTLSLLLKHSKAKEAMVVDSIGLNNKIRRENSPHINLYNYVSTTH